MIVERYIMIDRTKKGVDTGGRNRTERGRELAQYENNAQRTSESRVRGGTGEYERNQGDRRTEMIVIWYIRTNRQTLMRIY